MKTITVNPNSGNGFDTLDTLKINVGENEEPTYKIVYPKVKQIFKDSPEVVLSSSLASSIGNIIGKEPAVETDSEAKNDSGALEILIGLTDYNETAAVTDEIGYGDYIIKAVGNKIIIFGYTPQALEKAVEDFINICTSNYSQEEKTITLTPEKIYRKETVNTIVNELPVMSGENRTATYFDLGQRDAYNSVYQIAISNATLDVYSEYCDKLKAAGYETYLETYELGQNKFSSYIKGEYYVFVGFFEYDKYLRINIEKNANIDAFKKTETEKITTSQISLLGLEYANNLSKGLSTLIRLEDGRFAVVDGGYHSDVHVENFVKIIKDQAKEYTTEPVIAAWVITHADVDHISLLRVNFTEIALKHGITIENVFFFKSSQKTLNIHGIDAGGFNLHHFDSLMSSASQVGTKVYKPVTGQVCYFSNMKLEFLATPSTRYSRHDFGYDVVSRMILTDTDTGKTTSIFNNGDAVEGTFKDYVDHFGKYLKSDIVVLAHHASHLDHHAPDAPYEYYHTGYKLINASVVFSPVGWVRTYGKGWTVFSENNPNYSAFYAPDFKECYIAGMLSGMTTVPVPYVPGTVVSTGTTKIEPDMSHKE